MKARLFTRDGDVIEMDVPEPRPYIDLPARVERTAKFGECLDPVVDRRQFVRQGALSDGVVVYFEE